MRTTTHVAGEVMTYDDRTVQRCAWCGHALINATAQALAAKPVPEGTLPPDTWPLWPGGDLVRQTWDYDNDDTDVRDAFPPQLTLMREELVEWGWGEPDPVPADSCMLKVPS